MNWVSNTGPLIALAKIDALHLLRDLAAPSKVRIPVAVSRELWAKPGPETAALEAALGEFIEIVPAGKAEFGVEIVTMALDEGERQVVILGSRTDNPILLIDDLVGRKAAQKLELPVIGSAGLLLRAKQQGLVEHVQPLLIAMRRRGYWLADELVEHICRLAGELL